MFWYVKLNTVYRTFLLLLCCGLFACDSTDDNRSSHAVIDDDSNQLAASKFEQEAKKQSMPDIETEAKIGVSGSDGLLAGAQVEAGKRLFNQCIACHTLKQGEPNRVGPNLWGVLGRKAGAVEGFNYSNSLAKADFSWDIEKLNRFIENPNQFLSGTTMIFAGVKDAKARRDLLAYLQQSTSN